MLERVSRKGYDTTGSTCGIEQCYMNILVIDSGINSAHPVFKDSILLTTGFEKQLELEHVMDSTGHGTAVASLIAKDHPDITMCILKLFDELYECEIDRLISALSYIAKNNIYDIINMSFGILTATESGQIVELEKLCQLLSEQGSIIVAAFDNDGAISYPAAFDCVLGVDTSELAHRRSEYEYVTGSCVNIMAYGTAQKVAWNNPAYTIIDGNSFSCANITNQIAALLKKGCEKSRIHDALKENAIYERAFDAYVPPARRPEWLTGMKAIILPFSKEAHSLIAFEELLDFEIVDIYDVKYTARVGKSVSSMITYCDVIDRIIKNYDDVDWHSQEFNAVIVGHVGELSATIKREILKDIISKCLLHNKKLYAFDDLGSYANAFSPHAKFESNVYYPVITFENVPKGRFGKMHTIMTPVLAVIGTSSSQGKFTLQLSLRKQLIKAGYHVGQIGSEPTAYCFGMDFVYPYGYKTTTYTIGQQNVQLLNQALHEIDRKACDICLVGTQANTAFYATDNLNNFPMQQLEVLFGTLPDAFVLVVNAHDDIDYIIRTMKGTEYLAESKCLAIVVYPLMKKPTLGSIYKKVNISQTDWYMAFKKSVAFATNVPVLDMSQVLSTNSLMDIVTSYFSQQSTIGGTF